MGFFSNLRRSAQKGRLIKSASAQVEAGDTDGAVTEIWNFMQSDPEFMRIIKDFSATKDDVDKIISTLMLNGAGGTYHNFFVPVSAVLIYATFAYCLRALRGQVSMAEAAYQVEEYFRTDSNVFAPEAAFHKQA